MPYTLFSELNVSANNGIQLITGLNKTSLLIEINGEQTFQNGDLIERIFKAGRRFGVRWIQGAVKGFLNPLEYGQNEILLDVPNPLELFDVEIVPDRYQFEYSIKIYIKQLNPRFNVLAEKLGITLEILQAFPEQTLLFLEGWDPMANTDTRTTNAKLEALDAKADQALQTGQNAQSTAQSTADSLTQAKTEMVLNREYELTSAMFALENGFRVADITHDLMGSKPDMSLTDAQGDDQGFAQLISKSPTVVRVELSPTQWTDNSYPMFLTLQGLKGSATVGAGLAGADVPGMSFMIRLNQTTIERSEDGGLTWLSLNNGDALNVETALIDTNGLVHVKLLDGFYNYGAGNSTEWTASNSAVYAAAAAEVNAIVL